MNCGIYCLKCYFDLINYDGKEILEKLEEQVNEKGLSFSMIIDTLSYYGFEAKAYYDKHVYKEAPYLLYDHKREHYYLVKSFSKYFVYLSDVNLKDFKVFRLVFRLIWFRYYLVIR